MREELLGHWRGELIEPPSANRVGRIISSALHQADTALKLRISPRIPPAAAAAARMLALIAEANDDPGGDGDDREAFAFIKADPGDVSLKTCEEEAAKLALLRHIGAVAVPGAARAMVPARGIGDPGAASPGRWLFLGGPAGGVVPASGARSFQGGCPPPGRAVI